MEREPRREASNECQCAGRVIEQERKLNAVPFSRPSSAFRPSSAALRALASSGGSGTQCARHRGQCALAPSSGCGVSAVLLRPRRFDQTSEECEAHDELVPFGCYKAFADVL